MKLHPNTDLVTLVLPRYGNRMPVKLYKQVLVNLGYSKRQAICSLAGSISAGTVVIIYGVVCRCR